MSHSQFHCTARVYLDMHGLIFETSICYWQDQPGSRATGHDPTGPARRRPLSLLPSLSLSPARSAFPSGPCRVDGGGRRGERLSAGRAALRRSLARSLADHDGEARPIPGAAPPTSPPRGRSGDRCAAAFGGTLRAPPAGAGLALAPHGRPGLTRPPGPAEKRTGKRSPAAGDGRARGERDLETGATPRSETLSRGGTLRSGRGRGRKTDTGCGGPKAEERPADAPGPHTPTDPERDAPRCSGLARSAGRSPPLSSRSFFFCCCSLRLGSPRFPSVATPPACCSRPALAGPRNEGSADASLTTKWVRLRLAGPLGRHTAGFGRASPGAPTGRADRRVGTARPRAPKPPPPPPSAQAGERLTSRTTGSELERRPPVPEHRTPPRLPWDRERRAPARRGPSPTRPEWPHRSVGERGWGGGERKEGEGASPSPRRGGKTARARAGGCAWATSDERCSPVPEHRPAPRHPERAGERDRAGPPGSLPDAPEERHESAGAPACG